MFDLVFFHPGWHLISLYVSIFLLISLNGTITPGDDGLVDSMQLVGFRNYNYAAKIMRFTKVACRLSIIGIIITHPSCYVKVIKQPPKTTKAVACRWLWWVVRSGSFSFIL